MKKTGHRKKKKGISISTIVLVAIMLIGLSVMLYPTVSDYVNSFSQSRAIVNYTEAVGEMSDEEMEALLQEAEAFNERLLTRNNRYVMSDEERAEYESILNFDGSGMMGYIQIPRIAVSLPVYHGTSDKVLNSATGHIEGSSFPVGGEWTHAALSGHRGLPSAKLFTDLDELAEGDLFTITILNRTVTYQVDQIRIVLPNEMNDLSIFPSEDYCTLITCTPYGINTHRMLVRGTRVDNLDDMMAVPADALKIPVYIAGPAVMIPMLFVALIILLYRYRRKGPRLQEAKKHLNIEDVD